MMKNFLLNQIGARLVLMFLGVVFFFTAMISPTRAILGLEAVKVIKVKRR